MVLTSGGGGWREGGWNVLEASLRSVHTLKAAGVQAGQVNKQLSDVGSVCNYLAESPESSWTLELFEVFGGFQSGFSIN